MPISLHDEVDAALGDEDTTVQRVRTGREVIPAVKELDPDLVILDLQIGNMGGMATCLSLRSEEGAGRLRRRPVHDAARPRAPTSSWPSAPTPTAGW